MPTSNRRPSDPMLGEGIGFGASAGGAGGRGGSLPDLRAIPRTNIGATSKGEYNLNLEAAQRRVGTLQDFKRQQNLNSEPRVDSRSPYFEVSGPLRGNAQTGSRSADINSRPIGSSKSQPSGQREALPFKEPSTPRPFEGKPLSEKSASSNPFAPNNRSQMRPPRARPNDPPSRNTPSRPNDRSGQLPSPSPFPDKPENQPLGDRPSKNRLGNPNAYGIPEGQPGNNYVPNNAWLIGANYQATVEFEYSNGVRTGVPGKLFFVGPVYAIRQKHGDGGPGMIEYYNGTEWLVAGSNSSYGTSGAPYTLVELGTLECVSNCGNSPAPGSPPTIAPAPPLQSPRKERSPDFKPIPNGFPNPEPLPSPFPQPQPQPPPPPIQKPQQQPKPDADKEPGKSPSARRNPKPTPRPDVKPIPAPNTTGSGSFPKPNTSGAPEGFGQNQPENDFDPPPNLTPPFPSPTPNSPEPFPPNNPSDPFSLPSPNPNPSPNPDNKDPNPMVQFPPFPVAPKLNSGNACKTADPCTQSISSGVDSANKKADDLGKQVKDISDVVDKVAQLVDLSLLTVINNKLGEKVEGGLSGQGKRTFELLGKVGKAVTGVAEKLGKFAKWARLGQLMSVLTFITTLHNALMLSRNLGETLLSMLSNGLAVFGIKDDNNAAYDLGELIGKTVESMMKETIGTENYTTLSTNFKKANRIYQAAANLGNSIQSLRFSVVSALETIGGWNARIGNALKRSGVVNESSYSWMNPSPNFDNKFTQALETIENTVSQIDSVASEILSAQETVTQIASQKDELGKSLGLGTEKPQTENQPQKDKAIAAKAASVSPNIEATDLNKPGV